MKKPFHVRFLPAALGGAALALLCGGCSTQMVTKTIAMTGKVAIKTVTVAGTVGAKTTTAAITTSGKLAGTVVQTAAGMAAGAAKTGMVVFVDSATGVAKEIPWVEGMKLYAAGRTAEFDLYLKAFEIVSANTVLRSDWGQILGGKPEPMLKPGDVVRVSQMVMPAKTSTPGRR